MSNEKPSMALFWGCFIALITTAFAFITRAFLCEDPDFWKADFGLDGVQAQALFGQGIWSFAVSIIVFSLIIDKVGYRFAMIFSFVCYALYAVFALMAYGAISGAADMDPEALAAAQAQGLKLLTYGSIILGLGNGTVEAFINPVVATMFSKDKTKWLNILHAGWPGGLVLGGIITILLGEHAKEDWRILVYVIALPALVYLVMLIKAKFPVNERVASGVSYREMLGEFGIVGALIAFGLVFLQLGGTFGLSDGLVYGLIAVSVIAYGVYCRRLGNPLLILLLLVMMPLATTEIGTDGAITGIMASQLADIGWSGLTILIYTSAIMAVLRFFAGPIVKALGPLGLLAVSAALAAAGLFWLSSASGVAIVLAAATLYGVGKTFFWPTIIGVVAEQTPKGGALTLNAIAGIGMLTVGVVGGKWIGAQTENVAKNEVVAYEEGLYEDISKADKYILGNYTAIDNAKVDELGEEKAAEVKKIVDGSKQKALATVAFLPIIMLVTFLGLIFYFKSKGGYKPVVLADH